MYKFDRSFFSVLYYKIPWFPWEIEKKHYKLLWKKWEIFHLHTLKNMPLQSNNYEPYLLKKYLKANVPNVKKQDITDLIDIVLVDLEKSKFISDKFYSESKSRSLIQRGSSINKIRNYLMVKGIDDKYIKESIEKIKEDNSDQDFFSGIKICKKKE